jgi:hypothetical protein
MLTLRKTQTFVTFHFTNFLIQNYPMLDFVLIIIESNIFQLGASTVKWTALDPCSGLSESDPKQYTNFEFYEIKIYKHLENI